MSKVKGFIDVYDRKEKLRHSLRRKESALKKASRMRSANGGAYSYGCGYYVMSERKQAKYKTEVVPAHTEEKRKVFFERVPVYDTEGKVLFFTTRPRYETETVRVPERKVRKCIHYSWEPITPYLRRINIPKKSYKKMAARKVRRESKRIELSDGASYKRMWDIAWEIW